MVHPTIRECDCSLDAQRDVSQGRVCRSRLTQVIITVRFLESARVRQILFSWSSHQGLTLCSYGLRSDGCERGGAQGIAAAPSPRPGQRAAGAGMGVGAQEGGLLAPGSCPPCSRAAASRGLGSAPARRSSLLLRAEDPF